MKLMETGIDCEVHHHEVATAGQGEIGMSFSTLTTMADKVMMYKYILKNIAKEHGKTITFMPKPLFGDNGTGMHVHQSLAKNGENLFFDEEGIRPCCQRDRHVLHRRTAGSTPRPCWP